MFTLSLRTLWRYRGLGILFLPKLHSYDEELQEKIFRPGIFLSFSLFCLKLTLGVEIGRKYRIKQKKYQVKNFSYDGLFSQPLPGYASWKIKTVTGWSNDPGMLEVLDTDNQHHLVPAYCISQELAAELPVPPDLSDQDRAGRQLGLPSSS